MLGPPPALQRQVPDPERFDAGGAVTLAVAVLAVASAFYLPPALLDLVRAAARVVETGR